MALVGILCIGRRGPVLLAQRPRLAPPNKATRRQSLCCPAAFRFLPTISPAVTREKARPSRLFLQQERTRNSTLILKGPARNEVGHSSARSKSFAASKGRKGRSPRKGGRGPSSRSGRHGASCSDGFA